MIQDHSTDCSFWKKKRCWWVSNFSVNSGYFILSTNLGLTKMGLWLYGSWQLIKWQRGGHHLRGRPLIDHLGGVVRIFANEFFFSDLRTKFLFLWKNSHRPAVFIIIIWAQNGLLSDCRYHEEIRQSLWGEDQLKRAHKLFVRLPKG